MLISLVLFVIVSIVAVYFADNNPAPISLNLLGYHLQGPAGLVVAGALGLGFLLGVLFLLPAVISRSWSLVRHRRKLQDLQDEMQRKGAGKEPEDE